MPMGEALRKVGLDELEIAGNMSHVVGKLKEKTDSTGTVEKLLLDALKECMRNLDSPDASANKSATPVVVQLVHNVPRPQRAAENG